MMVGRKGQFSRFNVRVRLCILLWIVIVGRLQFLLILIVVVGRGSSLLDTESLDDGSACVTGVSPFALVLGGSASKFFLSGLKNPESVCQ